MFFKKKLIEIHQHEVERKDWENVLEALFRNTIVNSVKGIGIICNTCRKHPGDGEGFVQEELIYHIKQNRADEVRSGLKKIDKEHFKNIFKNYSEGNQKGLDFYRIKNILANEIIVYPLLQGETKYGLLVFDYPIDEQKTSKVIKVINGVLKNPEIPSTPPPKSTNDEYV
ncbi:MAG: hypothetical protein MAG581_01594 [Deltaproteobacteria bacterium]|nr:hypothetical protein [Deltaproteobacteria bacterium]